VEMDMVNILIQKANTNMVLNFEANMDMEMDISVSK
jgi:hypothetical protein